MLGGQIKQPDGTHVAPGFRLPTTVDYSIPLNKWQQSK